LSLRSLLGDLEAARGPDRQERLARWAIDHRLTPENAGLEASLVETFHQMGNLLGGTSAMEERRTVAELVAGCEDCITQCVDLGLIDLLSDDRLRLTPLGKLLVR
jgi:hypothetical protein